MSNKIPNDAVEIKMAVPAEFWPALGYDGEARYVAIYWERAGDEASWSDGRLSLCGACYPAYSLLMDQVPPGVRYIFGSSEDAAQFWIVVDREGDKAWAVVPDDAYRFLLDQWPPQPPMSEEEQVEFLNALMENEAHSFLNQPTRTLEEIMIDERVNFMSLKVALMRVRPDVYSDGS